MLKAFINKIRRLFGLSEEPSYIYLFDVLGFKPKEEAYYLQALTHRSIASYQDNNERLEFLGDSILEAIVSDYLYKERSEWSEGKLTSKRSEWVSRATNNAVAQELGLMTYIKYNKTNIIPKDMLGNALEALIGAIFLDYGYAQVYYFFISKMLPIIMNLEKKEGLVYKNYKSQLLELSQEQGFIYDYQVVFAPKHGRGTFRTAVAIGEDYDNLKVICEGRGRKKKEAEQEAARLAIEILNN